MIPDSKRMMQAFVLKETAGVQIDARFAEKELADMPVLSFENAEAVQKFMELYRNAKKEGD